VQPLAQLGAAVVGHHVGAQALVALALQQGAQPGQPALVSDDGRVDVELRHHAAGLLVEQHQFAGLAAGQRRPVGRSRQPVGAWLE